MCGKECKTTVGVFRKDKRENAVNGPGRVSRLYTAGGKNGRSPLWVVISGRII